jgi:phosphoketolase
MTSSTLTPELLRRVNAYWRAANYVSVGQIYLYDNPLLKRPLQLATAPIAGGSPRVMARGPIAST